MEISWEYRNSNLRFSTQTRGSGFNWGAQLELCEVLCQIFDRVITDRFEFKLMKRFEIYACGTRR